MPRHARGAQDQSQCTKALSLCMSGPLAAAAVDSVALLLALASVLVLFCANHGIQTLSAVQDRPPEGQQQRPTQDAEQSGWETQCVLLLWLAQLVLIPFDLALVDSSMSTSLAPGCSLLPDMLTNVKHIIVCSRLAIGADALEPGPGALRPVPAAMRTALCTRQSVEASSSGCPPACTYA